MSVWEHIAEWGGLPVRPFLTYDQIEDIDPDEDDPADAVPDDLPAAGAVAWKIATHYDGVLDFDTVFRLFREHVDTAEVTALALGYWDTDILMDASSLVDFVTPHADAFPTLRHLYLCDIVGEESEVSWIPPEDITPVLDAFPHLESLVYRFGQGHHERETVVLRPTKHRSLRRLELQTGGMPGSVPRAVAACDFPALQHLDLWLGVGMYGGNATVADLAGLLDGSAFPALRRLGLMNSEIQDDIARAIANAPVVARLTELDLSMGMLSDDGAEALLTGQPLTHLTRLNLRHHFMSEQLTKRLHTALAPTTVDTSDVQTPWDGARTPAQGRYTEVSE